MAGGDVVVYVIDKEGGLIRSFPILEQAVEGMGGKNDFKPEAFLSQFANYRALLEMVEARGELLSQEQAEGYIGKFEDSIAENTHWRYWNK